MRMLTLILPFVAALPTWAVAQDSADGGPAFTATATVTIASRYVSGGFEYSDGPVLQPYLELGLDGFYAGIWASNGSKDLLGANSEIDLYVGYRGEAGAFYYDVGYGQYLYPGASENNSGEVLASAGMGFNETVYLTGALGFDPDTDTLDTSLTAEYSTPIEGLSLAGTYGQITNDGGKYWSVGADYAFNDNLSAGLTWEDNDTNGGIAVLAISSTFNLR